MAHRNSGVRPPGVLFCGQLTPIGVYAHGVAAILRDNVEDIGPDHKLIRVRQIQDSRKAGGNSAEADHIGIPPGIAQGEVFQVEFFVGSVVGRMLPHALVDRSTLAGLRSAVENGSAHHAPYATPVGEFIERSDDAALPVAEAGSEHAQGSQRE